jgi:AcrR family transcriptional regulator
MSQGNVYWYFSSKEELLKAVLADGFETLGALMQQAAIEAGAFQKNWTTCWITTSASAASADRL